MHHFKCTSTFKRNCEYVSTPICWPYWFVFDFMHKMLAAIGQLFGWSRILPHSVTTFWAFLMWKCQIKSFNAPLWFCVYRFQTWSRSGHAWTQCLEVRTDWFDIWASFKIDCVLSWFIERCDMWFSMGVFTVMYDKVVSFVCGMLGLFVSWLDQQVICSSCSPSLATDCSYSCWQSILE